MDLEPGADLARIPEIVGAAELGEHGEAALLLERAEHLEDLLGGTALEFGRDLVAVPSHQPLTEAQGGPPGGGQGQACQARRSAQGATRDVCHRTIVSKAWPGACASTARRPQHADSAQGRQAAAATIGM